MRFTRFSPHTRIHRLNVFHELRRKVERELYYWIGFRCGHRSVTASHENEHQRLHDCSIGSEFIRFYLETANDPAWKDKPMRWRWHWLRRSASPYHHGGTIKDWNDRNQLFSDMLELLNHTPSAPYSQLP